MNAARLPAAEQFATAGLAHKDASLMSEANGRPMEKAGFLLEKRAPGPSLLSQKNNPCAHEIVICVNVLYTDHAN